MKLLLAKLLILLMIGQVKAEIPSSQVELAVTKMAKLIREKYVFSEKGKAISGHLLKEYKTGKLNNIQSWQQFSSISTKIISEYSQDGHMFVSYDPKRVTELNAAEGTLDVKRYANNPYYFNEEAIKDNFGFKEVKILADNIGFIKVSQINLSEKSLPVLSAAMKFVANTNALVIDLRDNGGGGSSIGSVFESYFLPQETPLLNFRSGEYGDHLSKTVSWLLDEKYTKPLFILINKGTASAAEAFCFSLQHLKRAVVVGSPSAGGAHMNSWYSINEHIYISISTGAPTLPGTEITWEQKGVQPDLVADPGNELKRVTEFLITKN